MPPLRSVLSRSRLRAMSQLWTLAAILAVMLTVAPGYAESQAQPKRAPARTTGAKAPVARPMVACTTAVAGKLPIQLALRHYIKQADPKPRRFLVAADTDSALSPTGTKVLQEFGPMYYYAGSENAKHKLRERLLDVGPYPALLVVKRASPKPTPLSEVIRLGGHYVTGEHDGKKAASLEFTFGCGAAGWEMRAVKTEEGE